LNQSLAQAQLEGQNFEGQGLQQLTATIGK
jgi:hypothetical protein